MRKPFISYDKLSKKQKRALNREKRGGWGAISPVTKRPERSEAYRRQVEKQIAQQQARRWQDDSSDGLLYTQAILEGIS